MKKKFKDLNENEVFVLQEGSDKMYRFVSQIEANGIIYYLTSRLLYGKNTGYWSTDGEKEVFTINY